jgi:uncharacterized protein (DUF1015 family)
MAQILPFRALRYNPERVGGLERVVTQPYDKITPEMQARYLELSPYNLVRIIRGPVEPWDTAGNNVYSRAARYLREWLDSGVLVVEREPALYPYEQDYVVPGQARERKTRRGFIALLRLEDYGARVVHRHEETLSAPKADRLELLKATRAHFGQIFLLYSDPAGEIERTLESGGLQEPFECVRDEYGTMHRVWRRAEPATIERVSSAMQKAKLVIADGHHRYETALAYRDLCLRKGIGDTRAEYVMATFIRKESEGLTILPTHRVLHGLSGFGWEQLASRAREFFRWEDVVEDAAPADWVRDFARRLAQAGATSPSLGVYGGVGRLALLRLREELDLSRVLPDVPAGLRRLDVVLLHRLLLEQVLGIDRQAVREEKNLRYVREMSEAVQAVSCGKSQACFLMNPTPVDAVWENALAGQPLPQKSTDFYPKLLSGLAAYWLDNPAGI